MVRVLLVEGAAGASQEVQRLLPEAAGGPYQVSPARGHQQALEALVSGGVDVALVDLSLDQEQLLRLLREASDHGARVPVVLLGQPHGEGLKLAAAHAGVVEVLPPEELTEQALQHAIRRALERARRHEAALARVFRKAPVGIGLVVNRVFKDVNDRFCAMLGYTREELLEQDASMVYPSRADYEFVGRQKYHQISLYGTGSVETQFRRKDGKVLDVLLSSTPLDPKDLAAGVTFSALDITDRKGTEEELRRHRDHLEELVEQRSEALKASEAKYRALVEWASDGIVIVQDHLLKFVNLRLAEMLGRHVDELQETPFIKVIHPESRQDVAARYVRRMAGDEVPGIYGASLLKGDGQKLSVELHAGTVEYEGEPAVLVVVRDVSVRLRAEQELREQRELLFQFLETVPAGVFVIDAASGNPFYSNRAAKQILGKGIDPGARPEDLAEVYQAVMAGTTDPYPTDRMPVVRALRGESSFVDDMVIRRPGGAIPLHVSASPIYNSEGRIAYATAAFMDVSERVKVEEKLRQALQELERSNQELEQFAYVASHDLQEPLRMVISFMQLLAKRYQGQLDERADEYIGYAVQGGQRMKDLISDLLALSRVGTRGRELSPTSCDEALDEALQNLKLALEEGGAEVTRDPLPEVLADPRQLVQLLQNLIDNAIKFRQQEAPRVHVSATRDQGSWRVAVQDNGIGIEPRFAGRIFVVFQRLHGMDQYSGSGIGLAICKKIIERHGGRIWFESEPGQGSTFYFTLQAVE